MQYSTDEPTVKRLKQTPAEEPLTKATGDEETVDPEQIAVTETTPEATTIQVDMSSTAVHQKARTEAYQGAPDDKKRFLIKDEEVPWGVEVATYQPVLYTQEKILADKPVWADADVADESYDNIKFNIMDGQANRVSYHGDYEFEDLENKKVPRNPMGRTGMRGRGLLGKWGPNHAADPIVTRFKRNEAGEVEKKDEKPILEFVAIQRRDTKEWAIPGGMVDGGEHVSATLKREFGEEALNSIEDEGKEETKTLITQFFKGGDKIYEGYVDDPRNTDNAWMETAAYNFHDDDGKKAGKIPLNAGDDAQAVRWMAIDSEIQLYASHKDFIQKVCEKLNAHF